MKLALAAAALLGLSLTPAAYAQVSCNEMRRVMTEAQDDFDNIKGKKFDDDAYESTYLIGGSRDCTIDMSLYPTYTCNFQFERPDWVWTPYTLRLGEVQRCLSGWKRSNMPGEPYRDEGLRTLEGVSFEGTGDYEDYEWSVYVQQHMQDGEAHYHIWIELAYW